MADTAPQDPGLKCEDARLIARDSLEKAPVGEHLLDDVLLVVSELVSNAVRHAGGVTDFHVRYDAGRIEVAVSDASRTTPQSPGTPAHVPGGFGWLLVNRIAERIEILPTIAGKTITASIPLPATT
ncbi:ATP-binding protein [Streptomyces sp. NPDC048507]|uniref:ATP-binding protein n=1 Tax=Streptomyces sp. NPDC048507 TaxID=3365560 RepID=UPI0037237E29